MVHTILGHNSAPRLCLQITLTHGQLLFLQETAEARRVTVSWILRALLRQRINDYLKSPPERPLRILGPKTRFNLVFHRWADKDKFCSAFHHKGYSMAALLRQMVADFMLGRFDISPGLLDAKEYQACESEIRISRKRGKRCVIQHHFQYIAVNKLNYWPQNPRGYRNLMALGRKNRQNPLQTPL